MAFSRLAVLCLALLLSPTFARAQAVAQGWQVNVANCAATGNHWLAYPNRGHGIAFIPGYAAANTYNKDILVLLSNEDANAQIRILDAATGEFLNFFLTQTTGSSFRDHASLAASTDGYIFVAGYNGTVQRYNVSGTFLGNALVPSMYPNGVATRIIAVTGSHTANSLKFFVGSGSRIIVFGNGTGGSVNYIGAIQTGKTGELGLIGAAGAHVYCASYPSPELYFYNVNYTPFSYSAPVVVTAFAPDLLKYSLALTPSGFQFALASTFAGRGECAMGYVGWTGEGFNSIPTLPMYDQNGNGVFDGGPNGGFYTAGASPGICIDPAGTAAYAYFPHYEPSPTGLSAAITKISISASAVGDWMVY